MDEGRRLTIVVLTYNSEKTVTACLNSLAGQEVRGFRVLVVDDDSTDRTLQIVDTFRKDSALEIEVVRNGSHSISKGRNIGLTRSTTDFVAFLDSDDQAKPDWTGVIIRTFDAQPGAALLSGPILLFAENLIGTAISTNDHVVRKFFAGGIMRFCTANSAFNKKILKTEVLFDEDFTYAEDLEIASRIQKIHEWVFVPEMQIHQTSRGTFRAYALQMYRYGLWKIYYGYVARDYRLIDFVPLIIGVCSIIAAILFTNWIPLLALPVFSLCESLFVITMTRRGLLVSLFTFPAWIVKNCAWSIGVAAGVIALACNSSLRISLKRKRAADLSIVQVAAYYPPHLGGLERVAQEISEQLARDGYAVTVLTSDIGAKDSPRTECAPKLTIKRLWSFDFAHTAFIPGLLWQLLRVRKPAIFHLHLAQAYVPEIVWLAAKLRGVPYIVHFHLDVQASGPLGFIFLWWKRWIQPAIIKGAAHVITLSPDQSALVQERYGVPAGKVAFIGNGVSEKFLAIGSIMRDFHDPLRLIFVGRLASQKHPERLIEALPLIASPVSLTLVGDGEDRAELEALVAKLGLRNVEFKGILRGDELLQAYREADVFVISSDREGMSLAILEAMAAGLPIIGSDVLGITEMIEGVGVSVKDPGPRTFAQAIGDLAAHPDRLTGLSAASFQKAQQYSWSKLAKSLESLYKEIGI